MIKQKDKQKQQDNRLIAPSLFETNWKCAIYNLIGLAISSLLFFGNYTIDDLCFELDVALGYGLFERPVELALVLITFSFFVYSFFRCMNVIRYASRSKKHIEETVENPTAKRAYEGVEGTGKTLNTASDVLYLSAEEDEALRLRYYLKYPFREELKDDQDYKALKESYDYYESHSNKIPHLMLNFKMKYRNREQYDFDMGYINQEKRLAEGFVIGLTEVGNLLPNTESKMSKRAKNDEFKAKEKTEFLSLSRQFTATKMVYDEQRTGEVFLPLRSVTGLNILLTDRRKVLNPFFLIFLHTRLKNRILRRREKTTKFEAKLYNAMHELIEDIGYYVFTYSDKEAIKDKVKSEDNTFVISCDIPFEFDTRGERYKYRLFANKPE